MVKKISYFFLFFLIYISVLDADSPVLSLLWKYASKGNIVCQPAIDYYGNLYFSSKGRKVYALAKNGKELWVFDTAGEVTTPIVVGFDNSIFVGGRKLDYGGWVGSLYPNGKPRWKKVLNNYPVGIAIGFNGNVYVGAKNNLYAFNYYGKELWRYTFSKEINVTPVVDYGDNVIICSGDGLFSIAPDGEKRWFFHLGFKPKVCVADKSGNIYVGGGRVVALNIQGGVLWDYVATGEVRSIFLGTGGRVFSLTSNGDLYVINSRGTLEKKYSTHATVRESFNLFTEGFSFLLAGIETRGVFLLSGNLHSDLIRVYRFPMRDGVNNLVYTGESMYVALNNWNLYRFNIEGMSRGEWKNIKGLWNRFLHDNFHTSRAGALGDMWGSNYKRLKALSEGYNINLVSRALREVKEYLGGNVFLPLYAPEIENICKTIIDSGVGKRKSFRLEVSYLLGKLKTRNAVVMLERLIRNESDSFFISVYIRSLGEIGVDPYRDILATLLDVVYRYSSDTRVMFSVIDSLGSIIEINGIKKSRDYISVLARIAYGDYSDTVRKRASFLIRTNFEF